MKKRNSKDFLILLLFYTNLAIYVGGDLVWKLVDEKPHWIPSIESKETKDLVQKYSQRNGLDWRFVLSMIDAESSFNNEAVSPAGAVGLMQVLPQVALAEGVTNIQDPEENIRFGIKHFKRYFNTLKGETMDDTLKINLAAYNAGIAHVLDAQKLAVYLNLNPKQWESLEQTLPLLEEESFKPFVEYGYCQGTSVVTYVRKVFRKYQQNRKNHPDLPPEVKQL